MKETVWTSLQIQSDFPAAQTFDQVLTNIVELVNGAGNVLCEVVVNDLLLTELEEQKFAKSPVSEIQSIKVRFQSPNILLDESLKGSQDYVKQLLLALENSAHLFRLDNLHHAHKYYQACIEGVQWFIDMVVHFKLAHQNFRGNLSAQWLELEQALTLVLGQILEAYEKKNYILVADLLEYDLITIFDRWRQELAQLEQNKNRESQPLAEIST